MKNVTGIIILLVFVFISMMGCQDVTVGYLMTSNATYTPDSMVVKAVLDPVEDERQIKFEIPWQSAPIEGWTSYENCVWCSCSLDAPVWLTAIASPKIT